MRRHLLHILCLALLGLPHLLRAQDPAPLREAALVEGGAAVALAAHNGRIYAGCGHTLLTFDARQPDAAPTWTKKLEAPIQALRVHRGKLYVAANKAGVLCFDLADPSRPAILAEHQPQTPRQAALDIAFRGDTVLAVMATEVTLLRLKPGTGTRFERLGAFAEQLQANGRVAGGAAHGHYFAALVGGRDRGEGDGVQIYDLRDLQRRGLYPQTLGRAHSASFSQDGKTLHVAAGSMQGGKAVYYALDLRTPAKPLLAFRDTIPGAAGSTAAMSILLVRDTAIVFAREAANVMACPGGSSYAWVYAPGANATIRRVGTLAFRRGPFCGVLEGGQLIVAEGAGGISRRPWPTRLGMDCDSTGAPAWKTTGSFLYAADAFADRVALALGDNGIALYQHTTAGGLALMHRYTAPGRCTNVKYSGTGTHLIAFYACPGGDSLRILDAATLKEVGHYSGRLGHEQVRMWQDRFYVMLPAGAGVEVIDLRDPVQPKRERGLLVTLNAIGMDNQGHLILTSEHTVKVIDVNGGLFREMGRVSHWGEGFGPATGWDGHFFVHGRARGLVRFKIVGEGSETALVEGDFEVLPFGPVDAIAADKGGLYVAGDAFGLALVNPRNLRLMGQVGGPTGLGLQAGTGTRELFCWGGRAYWVDYAAGLRVLVGEE